MKVKCYTRWNKTNLICMCKKNNPGCDRFKSCSIERFKLMQYEGLEYCFKNNEKRK